MTSRELVNQTIRRAGHDGHAFWVGHPAEEAKRLYCERLGIAGRARTQLEAHNAESSVLLAQQCDSDELALAQALHSDMAWISPELDLSAWRHPEGKPLWDCFRAGRESLGTAGIFADCEDVSEVEAFDWPNPDYMDFSSALRNTKLAHEQGLAVFGGMWCPFFHIVADFFGMENYFIKMYEAPEVVHAVTRHVVDFLLETNRRYLDLTAPQLSAGFFGNDLGTQLSLIISLACFDEFLYPYIREIIGSVKARGLPVAMHSCGAIDAIIPRLIEAGVDVLHPLQAKAKGMDAAHLAAAYGGKITFMGGVDTQQLLPFGTPEQVRDEVLRLRDTFGGDFIVSPSHEALLPNVPFENVLAMSRAAKE